MSMLLRCGTIWMMKNLLVETSLFLQRGGTTVDSRTSYNSTTEERNATLLYMYANIDEMNKDFE
jgi:hypothetical protein